MWRNSIIIVAGIENRLLKSIILVPVIGTLYLVTFRIIQELNIAFSTMFIYIANNRRTCLSRSPCISLSYVNNIFPQKIINLLYTILLCMLFIFLGLLLFRGIIHKETLTFISLILIIVYIEVKNFRTFSHCQ